jgi:predicted dehydrogenase
MNVIIVGLGSIGMRHARNFRESGASIVAGVDPSEERRARFGAELGACALASLDDALARKADLAIIASPSALHVQQALQCVAAGCHLFLEKPIGDSLTGVPELIAAIEQRRLFAHVSSNFKFHRASPVLRGVLDSGVIGHVASIQVLAGEWLPGRHPWEDYRHGYAARRDLGGGIVLDTHEFDYLAWLFGTVERFHGFATRSGCLEIDTEDVACACLHFASGALATVQIDYIQREYRRRYHISGDKGTVEWDFTTGTLAIYDARSQKKEIMDVAEDVNEMYVRQTRHIVESIAAGGPPMTPVAHAARVLELQLGIRSARV